MASIMLLLSLLLSSLISHVYGAAAPAAACYPGAVITKTCFKTSTKFGPIVKTKTVKTTLPQRTSTKTVTSKTTIIAQKPLKTVTVTVKTTIPGKTLTKTSTVTSKQTITSNNALKTTTVTIKGSTLTTAITVVRTIVSTSIKSATVTLRGTVTTTLAATTSTVKETLTTTLAAVTSTIKETLITTLPAEVSTTTTTLTTTLPGEVVTSKETSTTTLSGSTTTQQVTITTTVSGSLGCPTGNLIRNEGFEDSETETTPWVYEQDDPVGPGSGLVSEGTVRGRNHYRVTLLGNWGGALTQRFFLCRKKKFTLRLWAKVDAYCFLDITINRQHTLHPAFYSDWSPEWKEYVFNTDPAWWTDDGERVLYISAAKSFSSNEPCSVAYDDIQLTTD